MSSAKSNGKRPALHYKTNAPIQTLLNHIQSNTDKLSPETRRTLLILLRAFALGWSVSGLPALLGVIIKALVVSIKTKTFPNVQKLLVNVLRKLYRSITNNGLPWLFCGALGGHRLVEPLLKKLMKDDQKEKATTTTTVKDQKRLVISSMIASVLTLFSVHRLFPRTGTLDITLFAAVRAGDVFAHRFGECDYAKKKIPTWMLYNGDVIVFILACTEIMSSWFFAPARLPR